MDLIVYGASDDLVEIEGLVSDELYPPYDKPAVLTIKVDDAAWARVRIEYTDDGIWRVGAPGNIDGATVVPARGEDEPDDEHGCPGYSDKAVIPMVGIEARRVDLLIEAAI